MTSESTGSELSKIGRRMRMAAMSRQSVPSAGNGKNSQIPQIGSPLLIGILGVGALGAGIAFRAMKPTRRRGRSDRFETLIEAGIDDVLTEKCGKDIHFDVSVNVGEGFGKPALVTFDITVDTDGAECQEDDLREILDGATQAVWDNGELAPLAIRGRIMAQVLADADCDTAGQTDQNSISADALDMSETGATSSIVMADMTLLGFDDGTARPTDLFERYGAPASDRNWRP